MNPPRKMETNAAKCQYKECDRLLMQQLITRLNDDGMIDAITGGSHLSHTAVKPDSHLAQILCIIYYL